nr:hypothetical protein [uncultured Cohaesibacter sp.]
MLEFLDRIPVATLVVVALTLGLAPFLPEPHIWEKLKMLFDGTLNKPIDIFDLAFHGVPWVLLVAKLARLLALKRQSRQAH